jgi:CubicO group peptidase (beta-lactamase class C family)
MKNLITILVLLQMFTVIFLSAESFSDETQILIEEMLEKESSSFKKGGFSFAIADDVMPLFSESYGWSDFDDKRPMTPDTTQNIASVTKLFTATAIMKLYSEGKVDLDVPISTYIPGFHLQDSTENDFTLRLLLTHYSGLPSNYLKGFFNSWDGTGNSQAYFYDFIEELQNEHAVSRSGDFYIYSNLGFNIAAFIISQVTGLSYEEYVRDNILKPLHMENSWYEHFEVSNRELATGYSNGEIFTGHGERGAGDGGLNSTVVDLT